MTYFQENNVVIFSFHLSTIVEMSGPDLGQYLKTHWSTGNIHWPLANGPALLERLQTFTPQFVVSQKQTTFFLASVRYYHHLSLVWSQRWQYEYRTEWVMEPFSLCCSDDYTFNNRGNNGHGLKTLRLNRAWEYLSNVALWSIRLRLGSHKQLAVNSLSLVTNHNWE